MWGLREQIKELREALEKIARLAEDPWHYDGAILKIAKAALDKR